MKLAKSLLAVLISAASVAGGEPAQLAAAGNVVLDLDRGSFRAFLGSRTPTLISPDGKLKPMLEASRKGLKEEDRKPLPVWESAPPAANWMAVDFDDSRWPRVERAVAFNTRPLGTPFLWDKIYVPRNPLEGNRVCVRGVFKVSDPLQVKDLKLVARYSGGAIVYVNGVEFCRGHLPGGKLDSSTLAERYPDSAYLLPDGNLRPYRRAEGMKLPPDDPIGIGFRTRTFQTQGDAHGVEIPSSLLRPGINVIAIEARTAPVDERLVEKTVGGVSWPGDRKAILWPHAAIVEARVVASSAAGLDAAGVPPSGIRISNSQPLETVRNEPPVPSIDQIFPIRMVGARNGVFSGKVVLSSAETIRNLTASVSDLVEAGGKARLPASAIQVRRAEPGTPKVSFIPGLFDRLLAEFPAEIPVLPSVNRRLPGKAAVAPIWVTVRVPADALAGEYSGTLTIAAEGQGPVKYTVPVQMKVNNWRLPDPKDFVTHNNIYQSPDSLAKYYDVPLWSDKHFELMGKSLKAFSEIGNKLCIVNLVVDSLTLGNSESMVRWVKKADGTFDYDFTIADKYMDLYQKISGKPGILRLDAWQRIRMQPPESPPHVAAHSVSVFDPVTGKVGQMPQPAHGTPENEAFWRPVLTELRKRLEKRGWFDVAAFSWMHYSNLADPEKVDIAHRIWPDGKWMHTAHSNPMSYPGKTKGVSMPVPYVEYVWGCGWLYDPESKGVGRYPRPWKTGQTRIELGYPRHGVSFVEGFYQSSPLSVYRFVNEAAQQGNLRGLGYLSGDFWPVVLLKDDRYDPLFYSYNGMDFAHSIRACFSPGPDGAEFNSRIEMFREGVQVCEAIIFLQRAVEGGKVSAEMEKQIADLMDERARYWVRAEFIEADHGSAPNHYHAIECSDWQERDDRLFALCAEVAAQAGSKP